MIALKSYVHPAKTPKNSRLGLIFSSSQPQINLLPVDLEKISFDGTEYYELKKDDLTETYSAPHWIKADGTNESVAFKRSSKPKVEAFFKLDVPDDLLAKIKIKGVASDGVEFPEQVLVKDGGSVKY